MQAPKPQFPLAPLTLLFAAFLLYAVKAAIPYLIFQPLSFPIDLGQATFRSQPFRVPAAKGHSIELEIDRLHSIPHEDCLLGGPAAPSTCKGHASKMDLTWTIYSNEKKIVEGKSAEGNGGSSSQKMLSRHIGRIPTFENIGKTPPLQANTDYILEIESHQDASALMPAHPRIKIDPYGEKGFHAFSYIGWFGFFAAPMMLIASIFWLTTWLGMNAFLSWKKHKN